MAKEIIATPVSKIDLNEKRDGTEKFVSLLNDAYHSGDIVLEETPRRGDLIRYSQDGSRRFYRTDNLAIFNGRHIISLDYSGPDDYGSPPSQFAFPEFPPNHWVGLLHMDYFPVDGMMLHHHTKRYYITYEDKQLPVIQYGEYHFIAPYTTLKHENINYRGFKWALLLNEEIEIDIDDIVVNSDLFKDKDVIVLQ